MGLDLQPDHHDGLTAVLAGHWQPDKEYPWCLRKKKKWFVCLLFCRETISHSQH